MDRRLFAVLVLFVGCTEPVDDALEFTDRTEVVCDDGAPAYEVAVDPRVTEIGPSANDAVEAGGAIWIVESQANTVSRFDVDTGTYDGGFVHVGGDRNPYAVAVDEQRGELWIANFLSDTVTVADADTGDVVDEIDDESFASPSSVAVYDGYAYVGNVDFRGGDEGFGPGSISVIDLDDRSVVGAFDAAFKNPQFAAIAPLRGNPTLLISGTGAVDAGDGTAEVVDEGGLEWFRIGDDPVDPPGASFAVGQQQKGDTGAIARALVADGGERLYFASGVAPAVFSFDVADRRWLRDAESPIELYDADGDATHRAAMGPDGLMWITAFNEDALYLLDTACDRVAAGPIDLGVAANMLEGPHALVVVDGGDRIEAYYISTLANSLGRIALRPQGDPP